MAVVATNHLATDLFAHGATNPEGKGGAETVDTNGPGSPGLRRFTCRQHAFRVVKLPLGHPIAQRIPVPQEIHPQHRLHRHRRAPAVVPTFG